MDDRIIHIESTGPSEKRNPSLCGAEGSMTYKHERYDNRFMVKPSCEACILVAWAEPHKVFIFFL